MDTTAPLTAGASVSFNVLNTNKILNKYSYLFRYQGLSGPTIHFTFQVLYKMFHLWI
jgi:hypothetical protein